MDFNPVDCVCIVAAPDLWGVVQHSQVKPPAAAAAAFNEQVGKCCVQPFYWKINGYFAKDVIIDDQTLLFSVPKDPIGADEDEFQMLKRSSLSEAVTYTIATYKTTDKVGFEQVAVIRTDSETQSASGNVYCMVEKVTTVLNDEGDTVQCLHAYNGREQKTWYVKDGYTLPETIEIGDIVRPTLNMNDEIIFLELTYDCRGAERPIFDDETADFHQQNRIMFGYGSDLVDSVFKVSFYPDGAESFLYDITDTAIIVYDPSQPEGKQIYQGTTGDISLYSYVGSECSRLLLQSSYEHARIIYVYK